MTEELAPTTGGVLGQGPEAVGDDGREWSSIGPAGPMEKSTERVSIGAYVRNA